MGRIFEDRNVNQDIVDLLDRLTNKETGSKEYANAMYALGKEFGRLILAKVSSYKTIALASTVEDADSLGKGIIDVLEENGKKVLLTVFWNKRFNPNKENQLSVAPIIKEFHEKREIDAPVLIIIKSIISSSCVVRTNLTKLIEESNPEQILVVAPVLLKGAIANLESEFDATITQKFNYLYFAEDDKKTRDGFVDPGIGGDVYKRLGFEGQDAKNKFIPAIVKERRLRYL
ncbi:MAG TPA: hypothetical protein VNS58_11980 [Puia sp.]|nr:hypothetical protein [Puia sp.]